MPWSHSVAMLHASSTKTRNLPGWRRGAAVRASGVGPAVLLPREMTPEASPMLLAISAGEEPLFKSIFFLPASDDNVEKRLAACNNFHPGVGHLVGSVPYPTSLSVESYRTY